MANSDSQIEVYSPDGVHGSIPANQLAPALAQGYKQRDSVVEAVHPQTGQTGIIPKEQWAAAQAQGFAPSPGEQARQKLQSTVQYGTVSRNRMIPGPGGGFQQQYKMTEPEHQAGEKMVLGSLGGAIGGELAGPAAAGLPWALRMYSAAAGAGAGTGLGELAGGAKPQEALTSAAATTAVGTAIGAGAKGLSEGYGYMGKQIAKLSGETPERIAELKQLPQTEEAIRGRVVQAEASSRTAFKSAYDNLGIDAEPVKLADVRPVARQAAAQLPAYPTPRPLSQVSDIPLPTEGQVARQIAPETMHPEEILANLNKYDNIPFRQAQQYRTAIEQYISKAKPPAAVYDSLKSVSNSLKGALSQAADNVGKAEGLKAADGMFQQHAADFWNKTAPLKPFLQTPPNATGATLTKFQDIALQGRALNALESRGIPTQDIKAILAKGPKLAADLQDAATLKNLGQPVLNQQVGAARREALKPLAVKAAAGLVGGGTVASGLYKLKQALANRRPSQ